MDRLTITLDFGSAAIVDGGEEEVMRIVTAGVVRSLNTPCGPNGTTGPLFDSNGNTVGMWRVS